MTTASFKSASTHSNPSGVSQFSACIPVTVVEPRRGWHLVDFADLWRYRELLWILAMRDVKVRYKQTVVGALWAVIQPLSTMVVFTVLFKLLGRTPAESGPVPYAVSLYCSLLPWQFFAKALAQSGESLVSNQTLITKVYFPRIIIPISAIITGFVDFGVAFTILLGMMGWYGIAPTAAVLTLPLFVALTIIAAFSAGIWLSALTAIYRDFRYIVPFVIQLGFYFSPVVFETRSLIPERWQYLFSLNPLVGVLDGFRWALLDKSPPLWAPMAASTLCTLLLLAAGLIYFRRMERLFADRI